MISMTEAALGSPVINETIASSRSRITSGLRQARPKIFSCRCRCSWATTLGPYCSSRFRPRPSSGHVRWFPAAITAGTSF